MTEPKFEIVEFQPKNVPAGLAAIVENGLFDKTVKNIPGWDKGTVIDALLNGGLILWVVFQGEEPQGVLILQPVSYPKGNAINVFAIAGHSARDGWMRPAQERLEEVAKERGFDWIEGWSIPAVARVLSRQLGYNIIRHLVVKPV